MSQRWIDHVESVTEEEHYADDFCDKVREQEREKEANAGWYDVHEPHTQGGHNKNSKYIHLCRKDRHQDESLSN